MGVDTRRILTRRRETADGHGRNLAGARRRIQLQQRRTGAKQYEESRQAILKYKDTRAADLALGNENGRLRERRTTRRLVGLNNSPLAIRSTRTTRR